MTIDVEAGSPCEPAVAISHPHGNENVRQACLALAQAGMLDRFWTCLAWNPDGPLHRHLPRRLTRELERRSLPPEVRPLQRLHPWRELARLVLGRALPALAEPAPLSANACAASLDRRVARYLASAQARRVRAIYAYDHGALDSFRVAKRNGQSCIYELPIGYWRAHAQILAEESDTWPGWTDPVSRRQFESDEFLRKDEEIALADYIQVPSRFVQRTLQQYPGRLPPVRVTPYGAPDAPPLAQAQIARSAYGPLRVLYVGALGLRKGAPYLFGALDHFGARIEPTVVGRVTTPSAPLRDALARCRWIESMPRRDVIARMRASDIFVFPTLFEGMALVVLEAMSQGCAVVTTPNAGVEDLVEDGVSGFLVPVRSTAAIVEVIERLDRDRDALQRVRMAASRRAAQYSWSRYRAAFTAALVDAGAVGRRAPADASPAGRLRAVATVRP